MKHVLFVTLLCWATASVAQPTTAALDPVKASAEITDDLAHQNIDAAAAAAAKLMASISAEKLKGAFRLVADLGRSQYTDLIYARDYGRTEKDLIFKIDFDKAFLFVRFLYHIDNGAWRLMHVHLKVENDEALPKDWLHIYPQ
jgi:hypothetical protein